MEEEIMRPAAFTILLVSIFALGILAGIPAEVHNQKPLRIEEPANKCSVQAYVIDPDPEGLNVRSGPGKDFALIGRLPKGDQEIEVTISGSSDKWVQIDSAIRNEDTAPLIKSKGWVYGPLLATQTRTRKYLRDPKAPVINVYAAASTQSTVVRKLPNETQVKIIGCKGNWVQIQYNNILGWLDPDSQCANTLTTCV
jgi:uncharacterized protein YgiM (DUF1202 family)